MTQTTAAPVASTRDPRSLRVALFAACYNDTMWPGTPIATVKLLERLGCTAVELRTDLYNQASQRAIEKLGARRDGVLRAHQKRRDGSVRDTVVYSITAAEWPDVKRLLALRLERLAGA